MLSCLKSLTVSHDFSDFGILGWKIRVNFPTLRTLHGMIYNIILLWGVIMQTDWHFNYLCLITSYYWMISHDYPDLGVWGLNLGVWGWIWGILPGVACKCSSGLLEARTMCSKKNTCCNPPPWGKVCLQSAFGLIQFGTSLMVLKCSGSEVSYRSFCNFTRATSPYFSSSSSSSKTLKEQKNIILNKLNSHHVFYLLQPKNY